MLFTSSSDGTTVNPTTPPDNGTDPTSGTDSTNGTDTTATSTPDTSMCDFFMLSTLFSVCHGVSSLYFFCSYHHIVHRSHCWYCGSLCCCYFTDISSWLWSWSDRICCLPEEVKTVNRCVVCSKEEQEVTSSVGLSITIPYTCMCVLIRVWHTHTHSSTMRRRLVS